MRARTESDERSEEVRSKTAPMAELKVSEHRIIVDEAGARKEFEERSDEMPPQVA